MRSKKDRCGSLLAYQKDLKATAEISKAEQHELSAKASNLRKFVEFRNGGRQSAVPITQQFR